MKQRLLFLIASLLLSMAGVQTAMAQKIILKLSGSEPVKYDVSRVEYIAFEEGEPPIIDDHEFVDLGLPSGTLWATCNVGANSPEEYGDYFAWGETEPKDTYSWTNYKYCNGSATTLTKYCTNSSSGKVDNITVLEAEDDAATVNWGSGWQMPRDAQIVELYDSNNTTTSWTTQNGVDGLLITSKTNGKTLFLPAAGYWDNADLVNAGISGEYLTCSLSTRYNKSAFTLCFDSSSVEWNYRTERRMGRVVRPVRKQ
ncbi:MAG: hypothetical protein IKQ37_08810 [Bacteroidaceae bacterium]|nr:hypothetical protein [Bacteroidaceae bacterium]